MSLKKKIKKSISKKHKAAWKVFFTRNASKINAAKETKKEDFWLERAALFTALFFFAFGMGLISDGKKVYQQQLKVSQRIDYKATQNYSTN